MAPILSKTTHKVDLRSSTSSTLRKGVGLRCLRQTSLVFLDTFFIAFAWFFAEHFGTPTYSPWGFQTNFYSLIPVAGIIISIIAARGLYSEGESRRDYRGLAKATLLGNVLILVFAFFYEPHQFVSRSHFLLFLLLSLTFTSFSHFLVDSATNLLRKKGFICYRVFLIADPSERKQAVELIEREGRYTIEGISSASTLDRYERSGTLAKMKSMGITEAFVTWDAIKRRLFISWYFQSNGITLRVIPVVKDTPLFKGARLWMIGGLPSLSFDPEIISGLDFRIKKVLDLFGGLCILALAFPLYLAIALAIRLDSPGPILYKQTRIGLHGRPFKAWKFRSMVIDADRLQKELEVLNKTKDGILFKLIDDPRITRVGKFLRKYSLDELPQVCNVVRGEMSLVGPRPLPTRDVDKFSEHHFIRHEVLPGITGLWQVSGRSDIDDFEDVMRLDLSYIENWSLWLDLIILIKTVRVVFQKSGAY
jgi:exopolysaccharide biosynthesis polyprenyl glycosylphosphotransferase